MLLVVNGPITSRGITDAVRDAELLAARVITGAAAGGASETVALAVYQATRD